MSYRSSRIDKRRGVWDAVAATDAGTKFNQNQRDKVYRSVKANAPGWFRWIPCGRKMFRARWIDPEGEREGGEGDLIIGRGISVGSPGTISGEEEGRGMIVPPLSLVATRGFITSRGHRAVFRKRA